MAMQKEKDAENVVSATEDKKARTRKKAANLKGTDSGMFSGMKKGDHSNEQPAR